MALAKTQVVFGFDPYYTVLVLLKLLPGHFPRISTFPLILSATPQSFNKRKLHKETIPLRIHDLS